MGKLFYSRTILLYRRVVDRQFGGGPIPYYDRAMRAEAAASVPIERGQTTVTASVNIVWEIAPAP